MTDVHRLLSKHEIYFCGEGTVKNSPFSDSIKRGSPQANRSLSGLSLWEGRSHYTKRVVVYRCLCRRNCSMLNIGRYHKNEKTLQLFLNYTFFLLKKVYTHGYPGSVEYERIFYFIQ